MLKIDVVVAATAGVEEVIRAEAAEAAAGVVAVMVEAVVDILNIEV